MSDLLSTISGKFSSALVLGAFFPAAVFVVLFRLCIVPLLPPAFGSGFLAPFAALGIQWEWLAMLALTILLSGLLYNLNTPLIRLYEGYPILDSDWGRHRVWVHAQRRRRLEAKREGLRDLEDYLRQKLEHLQSKVSDDRRRAEADRLNTLLDGVERQEDAVDRELLTRYPDEELLLPTELGNTIRSFELYPDRQYNIAAIPMWPRLAAKIDPAYAVSMDDAKASFDFMINSATLSGSLLIVLLLAVIANPASLSSALGIFGWLVGLALLFCVMVLFYRGSIERAQYWGELVKSAFDLYRSDLLKQLGYKQSFATFEDERELWQDISDRLIFAEPAEGIEFVGYGNTSGASAHENGTAKLSTSVRLPFLHRVLRLTLEICQLPQSNEIQEK